MPAYGRADALARTLESLLSQTFRDFTIAIVDDRPGPDVRAIIESYAAADRRLTYEANALRLGMVGNWLRAFERGRRLYPGSEYFAWVSDHDIWHPRWLEVLVRVLDEQPQVVLAYPRIMRMYERERRLVTGLVDTAGMTKRTHRLRAGITTVPAGNAIYGLFRSNALAQAGVFRPVLLPDRQVLAQLSLLGEFKQVPEFLWYREVAGAFSYARQRTMFFPGRAPLHTYFSANAQHAAILFWDLAVRGRGRPAFGRAAGVWYAILQWWYSTRRDLLRNDARWRAVLGRLKPARWLREKPLTPESPDDVRTAGTESRA